MGKRQKLSPEAIAALAAASDHVQVFTGPAVVVGDLNLDSNDTSSNE